MKLSQAITLYGNESSKKKELRKKTTAIQLSKVIGRIFGRTDEESWRKRWLKSETFLLMEIPLKKVAVVQYSNDNAVLQGIHADAASMEPIVVDINKRGIGGSLKGFTPPVIVVEGADRHTAARLKGNTMIRAWVGELAAKKLDLLHADDDIGQNELSARLGQALTKKYPAKKDGVSSYPGSSCWVQEVYPFESYCIVMKDGKQYRQKYTLDSKRNVSLDGDLKEVRVEYVDATNRMGERLLSTDVMKLEDAMLLNAGAFPRKGLKYDPAEDAPGAGVGPRVADKKNPRSDKIVAGKPPRIKRNAAKDVKADYGIKLGDGDGGRLPKPQTPERGGGKKFPTGNIFQGSSTRIKKIYDTYKAAVTAGYKSSGDIEAKAPPGMEDMVQGLKKHFGEDSDVPFKIAWWKHNGGT